MRLSLLLLALLGWASSFKILVYNAHFAHSHVNFIGKMADAVGEAGHEVVMLAPTIDIRVSNYTGTHISRIIRVPPNDHVRAWEGINAEFEKQDVWSDTIDMATVVGPIVRLQSTLASQCETTLTTPGLLEKLREEHFDAAIAETYDICAFVLFHKIGLRNYAMAYSITAMDYAFSLTGLPDMLSYVPALVSPVTDKMSFLDRVTNVLANQVFRYCSNFQVSEFTPVINRLYPDFKFDRELVAQSSFMFLNMEPYIDFPRFSVQKIVPVGGIAVPETKRPLDEFWNRTLELRPHNVLISFGSILQSTQIPANYKRSIVESIKRFPNVTFIWKYEDETHNISQGIDNLVEVKWQPQSDLLRDGRINVFVSQCGSGSYMEAAIAGQTLLCIPLTSDGPRCSNAAKRMGTALVVKKSDLATPDALVEALRELLFDPKYQKRSKQVGKMLAAQPMKAKERLVKHLEFMAEFGPFDHLDHASRQQNFIQYYLLDVIAFFLAIVLILLAIVFFLLRKLLKLLTALFFAELKPKAD